MYDEEVSEEVKKEYFEMNLKAVEIGFVEVMDEIAGMYLHGVGVEKNLVEAIKWYEKAVEFGNVNAAKNLAIMDSPKFRHGYSGYLPNAKKSLCWLKKVLKVEEKDENKGT